MKTQSAKAKGRNLQKKVCADLLSIGEQFGLVADDIMSRSMGANGVDVMLSPAAKKALGDLAIECKNVECLNVTSTFREHHKKYSDKWPLLVHKRNHTPILVTLDWGLFLKFLETYARKLPV